MPESAPPPKKQLLQKSVQELVINGEQLPENYIHKDGNRGILDVPLVEIPVVDLGLLTSLSTSGEELEKLHSALRSWGCFQRSKNTPENLMVEGYGNDMILSEKQTLDWTDRLYLTVNPQDQRKLKFWPESPEALRDILDDYTIKLEKNTKVVLKGMARSLNLEDGCFLEQYGKRAIMTARFNHYPKCPRPDLVLGVKPHADGSAITILLPDKEVEGLQFQKDNQWFGVPIILEALLINVGDQAEIMTNEIFKSPVHRVVTNSERERISLSVFCFPELENEIEPDDGLVNESSPRLYKKVKNYDDTYLQYYQQGKRPIDALKI